MKEIISAGLRWIDVEHPSKADLERIRKEFPQLHPLTLEDALSPIQRPKINQFDDHLFIVLHFPVFEKRTHKITSSEVDMIVGKDYIVTVHDGRLRPLVKLVDEDFDDLVDHIEKIWSSLEEQKEVVEGLHESNLALVNTITNDVVRVLTVIT